MEREKERETERQTERETDRQTDIDRTREREDRRERLLPTSISNHFNSCIGACIRWSHKTVLLTPPKVVITKDIVIS